MSEALETLIDILNLEQIDVNVFKGKSPNDRRKRVFGGQLASQGLVAAGKTVANGKIRSLHCYFLQPGDISKPIYFYVDIIKTKPTDSVRKVTARQDGEAIFTLVSLFHDDETLISNHHQMPKVPSPDELPTLDEQLSPWSEKFGDWNYRLRPFDQRYIDPPHFQIYDYPRSSRLRIWMRTDGNLPDNRLLHACAFTYASDSTLLDSVLLPHRLSTINSKVNFASLEHSIWFHREIKADAWFLCDQDSPVAYGGLALARGRTFTSDGCLLATVNQEILVRIPDSSELEPIVN